MALLNMIELEHIILLIFCYPIFGGLKSQYVKRISAKDALDAEYFWTDPLPCDPKRYILSNVFFHSIWRFYSFNQYVILLVYTS